MSDGIQPPSTNWTPQGSESTGWTTVQINSSNWNSKDVFGSTGLFLLEDSSNLLLEDNVSILALE